MRKSWSPATTTANVSTAIRAASGCPECAFVEGIEKVLHEANLRWFATDTHGLLQARPRPRYGVFAPVFTPGGVAAFGRDFDSARNKSEQTCEGCQHDPRYRDFYRDIGFDLDLDYLKPHLSAPDVRSFTGIKMPIASAVRQRKSKSMTAQAALRAADELVCHFSEARMEQFTRLGAIMDIPPVVFSPYDAELFGHWWHEGPEFLNFFMRKAACDQQDFSNSTLHRNTCGICQPIKWPCPRRPVGARKATTRVWLNESNQWIQPHLRAAAGAHDRSWPANYPNASGLNWSAPSNRPRANFFWPNPATGLSFCTPAPVLITPPGFKETSPSVFLSLHDQIIRNEIAAEWLARIEWADNLFPKCQL